MPALTDVSRWSPLLYFHRYYFSWFFQKFPQVEGSRLNLETCIWVFYFHEESPCKCVSCVMQNPERKEREELSPGGLPGRPLREPRVTLAPQWRCPYIPAFHDHLSAGVNLHSVSQVLLPTQAFLHVATALLPLLCWLFLFYFWDRVLLCRPGGLKGTDPPASVSWLLRLKVCATAPSYCDDFKQRLDTVFLSSDTILLLFLAT